jgi:RecB family exonuclease
MPKSAKLPKIRRPRGQYAYSASQFKTFDRCERKWGFEKIEGIRVPPSASQALGIRVHSVIEEFLKGDVKTFSPQSSPEHKIAFAGYQWWPARSDILEIERKLELEIAGCPVVGYIDVDAVTQASQAGSFPLVIDHKTTSDFKWAMSEEELEKDIQQTIYSADALERHGAELVKCQWIYYLTKGKPAAKAVGVTLQRSQVEDNLGKLGELVERMEVARFAEKANELRPNTNACSDYGGCPHSMRCERSPLVGLETAFRIAERRQEEKMLKPQNRKLPPPRVSQTHADISQSGRQGLDPQEVLANWPADATDVGDAVSPPAADLPPPRTLGAPAPRRRVSLPDAEPSEQAEASPPPTRPTLAPSRPTLAPSRPTLGAAAAQPTTPAPARPMQAARPNLAPAPGPVQSRPETPPTLRDTPARPVLPPEAPKDVEAQEKLSEAQLKVIESGLPKAEKAEVIQQAAEAVTEDPSTDPVEIVSGDIRERLRQRFGDKATKDIKAAYLQLLSACIHSGKDVSQADVALEHYFELFGSK